MAECPSVQERLVFLHGHAQVMRGGQECSSPGPLRRLMTSAVPVLTRSCLIRIWLRRYLSLSGFIDSCLNQLVIK